MLRKQFRINIENSESRFFLSLFWYSSPAPFGKSFEACLAAFIIGIVEGCKMLLAHFVPWGPPARGRSHNIFSNLNPEYRRI